MPHVNASTWLPVEQYDRLIQLASRRETSVSQLLRDVIVFVLRDNP